MPEKPSQSMYGGMAVPEGVMMRSPKHYSVACRAPNGEIIITTSPVEKTWIGRQTWLLKPFLRGTFALLDTIGLGLKAMDWASKVQLKPEYQTAPEKQVAQSKAAKAGETALIGLVMVSSLAIGFLIFDASPEALAQLTKVQFGLSGIAANYVAEILKMILFIGYLVLIRRLPAILDTFRYHGAEHKAIHALEKGLPLTNENIAAQTRLHPRCGTNFAIIVILISFLVFPLIPRDFLVGPDAPHWLVVVARLGIKLAILPLVAGVSYEVIRAAGLSKDQRWVNVLLWPGLQTQLITTAEPEEKHIEVARASLEAAKLAEEQGVLTNTEDAEKEQPVAATT